MESVSFALFVPLPWSELVRRTVKDAIEDDILGLAAQLAYYFFLALFPALLFVLALASFFPLGSLTDDLARLLGPFVSPDVLRLIQEQMERLANADSGGLLTFAVLGALWSSSAAIVSIVGALNRAYDIEEGRPWWKVRLVAIGLTLGLAVFMLLAITLILLGPAIARYLGHTLSLGPVFEWAWLVLQWPLVIVLVSTAIALVFYCGPDAEQDWVWVSPGALVATLLWLLASLALKFYVANFANYNAAYGTLGAVIVLMLWFYVSSLAILVGAELNAEIEHASPHGKDPGEKSLVGRRIIGRRAARLFEERKRSAPAEASGTGAKPDSRPVRAC
jgi:membrane protein